MPALAEVAANEAIEKILRSDEPHTQAARQITALGYPTSESAVRRWRAGRDWAAARQSAVATLSEPFLAAPCAGEQGLQIAEAMRPAELPDDPVTLLACLEPYTGPGQRDLKVTRKQDSDGITIVTVTAVRDDFAEAAAGLMATRIATGEGDHRCLKRQGDNRAVVSWNPSSRAPLFPGSPVIRYRRYGTALTRKLKAVGWELVDDGDYRLAFRREGGSSTPDWMTDRVNQLLGLDDDAARRLQEESRHSLRVHLEGL